MSGTVRGGNHASPAKTIRALEAGEPIPEEEAEKPSLTSELEPTGEPVSFEVVKDEEVTEPEGEG